MRILRSPNVNFIRWRWHAIVLSVVVIAAGVATAVARGGLAGSNRATRADGHRS